MTFLACIVASAAVAHSYDWGSTSTFNDRGVSSLAGNGGALIFILGVIAGAFAGVLLHTIARGLFEYPHGGAIAFFVAAFIIAAVAVVMIAAPGLVFGDAGNETVSSAQSSLSDAEFAGLALLAGATLAALAGAITMLGLARARRRATGAPPPRDLT